MQWMAQPSVRIVTMCQKLMYAQLAESCAMIHGRTAAADIGHTNTVQSSAYLKASMTTLPLTLWIGSTTTATALGFNCSKLCACKHDSEHLYIIYKHYQTKDGQGIEARDLATAATTRSFAGTCCVLMSTPESQHPNPG